MADEKDLTKPLPSIPASTPEEAAKLMELMRAMGAAGVGFKEMSASMDAFGSALDALGKREQKERNKKVRYYHPDGQEIDEGDWRRLQESERERVRRAYQNDRIRVLLIWHGVNYKATTVPVEQAPLFEVEVCDRLVVTNDITGAESERFNLAPDGKTFSKFDDALSHYQRLLLRFSESKMVDGELVEVDNQLSPDRPQTVVIADSTTPEDDVGAW